MNNQEIEFGLDTPVFVTVDESGQPLSGDVVVRNTIEEAVLADAVGIDSFVVEVGAVGAAQVAHIGLPMANVQGAVAVADEGAGRAKLAGGVAANQKWPAMDGNHFPLPLSGRKHQKRQLDHATFTPL